MNPLLFTSLSASSLRSTFTKATKRFGCGSSQTQSTESLLSFSQYPVTQNKFQTNQCSECGNRSFHNTWASQVTECARGGGGRGKVETVQQVADSNRHQKNNKSARFVSVGKYSCLRTRTFPCSSCNHVTSLPAHGDPASGNSGQTGRRRAAANGEVGVLTEPPLHDDDPTHGGGRSEGEKGAGAGGGGGACTEGVVCLEATPQLVKVAVLGASGVGKTALVKQFAHNDFPSRHCPTHQRETYWTSAMAQERIYHLAVADLPPIHNFPASSFQEWSEYRQYGLRSAAAYMLVFDLTCPESFSYIKHIRDQIHESRDLQEVGVIVVGNKRDLLPESRAVAERSREVAALVRKQWKAGYIEVSAKYNYRVLAAFRELVMAVEEARSKDSGRPHNLQELHEVIESSKCTIL